MEFDIDGVCSKEKDEIFFEEHKFEVTAACMRLEPNTDGMLESVQIETKIEAMNAIAKKYEYGPFANLCESCNQEFPECDAHNENDIMFGWGNGGDNVCFCRRYRLGKTDERKSTIETETTDPGPAPTRNEGE